MSYSVALLVHTCDRYAFLFDGFNFFFNAYWSKEINATRYFATEEKEVNFPAFINIKSGKGAWADRLKKLLVNDVSEEYILYMQEDMWLSKPVEPCLLNKIIQYTIDNQLDCVKLHSTEVYNTIPTEVYFDDFQLAKINNEKSDFLMSHQITIWKKTFLLDQLKPNEHPWRNERKATKRMKQLNPSLYHVDIFSENGKPAINQNKNIAKQAAYYSVSINSCLNENIVHFFSALQASHMHKAYLNDLKRHYELQLTHDGKPKPRKEDVVKKSKKWLSRLISKIHHKVFS